MLSPDEDYDDDDYDYEDEYGDLVPLVDSSNSLQTGSGKASAFDIALERHHRDRRQENPSWFKVLITGHRRWVFRVTILVVLVWVGTRKRRGTSASVSNPNEAETECSRLQLEEEVNEILNLAGSTSSGGRLVEFCDPRLVGEKDVCQCQPTRAEKKPNSRREPDSNWERIFHQQRENATQISEEVDVLFLGDSITEHWTGRRKGRPDPEYEGVRRIFDQLFTKAGGGTLNGLALGIGGDRCVNLLYRLQNGAIPDVVQPKVIWLLIGANDLGLDKCSSESILTGNMLVLEEIQRQRPTAQIVINGLLPFIDEYANIGKEINTKLKCLAESTENVHYFDTSVVFARADSSQNTDLFVDEVHPNADGYRIWGTQAVDMIESLL